MRFTHRAWNPPMPANEMEVVMTRDFRPLTPEQIRDIVARAHDERAAFVKELIRAAYVGIKGWLKRAPAAKPARHRGPLAGANA